MSKSNNDTPPPIKKRKLKKHLNKYVFVHPDFTPPPKRKEDILANWICSTCGFPRGQHHDKMPKLSFMTVEKYFYCISPYYFNGVEGEEELERISKKNKENAEKQGRKPEPMPYDIILARERKEKIDKILE